MCVGFLCLTQVNWLANNAKSFGISINSPSTLKHSQQNKLWEIGRKYKFQHKEKRPAFGEGEDPEMPSAERRTICTLPSAGIISGLWRSHWVGVPDGCVCVCVCCLHRHLPRASRIVYCLLFAFNGLLKGIHPYQRWGETGEEDACEFSTEEETSYLFNCHK